MSRTCETNGRIIECCCPIRSVADSALRGQVARENGGSRCSFGGMHDAVSLKLRLASTQRPVVDELSTMVCR
jgi:hypothetical protein